MLQRAALLDGEEDLTCLSTARRAAELIQFYYPEIYDDHIAELAVTPATMVATVGLFLALADRDLIDMQPWWELRVATIDPIGDFRRRCTKAAPKSAMAVIYHSRANIWEPHPMVYGLDLQEIVEDAPRDRYLLIALIWRLWCANPLYISYFGKLTEDAHEHLLEDPTLVAQIAAITPLPILTIPQVRDAFWDTLNVEWGTDAAHPVTLGDIVSYAISMTDNIYAAYSIDDLNENYSGNYGIEWTDADHVQHVRAEQDAGRVIAVAFWELADIVQAYPPLVEQIAEALHLAAVQALASFPEADINRIKAEVRAAIDAQPLEDQADEHRLPSAEEAEAEGAHHKAVRAAAA